MAEVVEQEELAVVGIVLVVEMVVLDRELAGSPGLVGCVFCLHHHHPAETQSSFAERLDRDLMGGNKDSLWEKGDLTGETGILRGNRESIGEIGIQ